MRHNYYKMAAMFLAALGYYFLTQKPPPDKIYIIDLEKKPKHMYNRPEKDAVYLGFIRSSCPSYHRYSEWRTCESDDLVLELSHRGPQFLYFVQTPSHVKDLIDHAITTLLPNIVRYIKESCSATSTVYLISGDSSRRSTYLSLRNKLNREGLINVKIERIMHIL